MCRKLVFGDFSILSIGLLPASKANANVKKGGNYNANV